MVMRADVTGLLEHPRRRAIACAALSEPATVGGIAAAIGTSDGAIRSMVERLERDGLLEGTDRPTGRGRNTARVFVVADAHRSAVEVACRRSQSRPVEPDTELMLIPASDLRVAARIIAAAPADLMSWAARLRDSQVGFLVALRPQAPVAERDRSYLQLRDAGSDCRRIFVGESFSPGDITEYARQVSGSPASSLPWSTDR
jgi:hypothetical protein